jgi:hypothetical protein
MMERNEQAEEFYEEATKECQTAREILKQLRKAGQLRSLPELTTCH